MISATAWVPRGIASEFPVKYELDDEEMERINQLAQLNLDDARADLTEAQEEEEAENSNDNTDGNKLSDSVLKDQIDVDDDLKEFDMEHYDDDDNSNNFAKGVQATMFPSLQNEDVEFHENGEDPYISLPTNKDTEEEKEELQVYPTDNLVLATRTEDDVSYLDVYIYDDGAGFHGDVPSEEGDTNDPDMARGLVRDSSLYVHHDLMLPAFPLCVEWINYAPGSNNDDAANFAAIGTFDPNIEIWNLDCVDKAFPDLILGEPMDNSMPNLISKSQKKKKKGKKNSNNHVTTHHTDAVLSLAHNQLFRAILASTSADSTVKLWDLNSGTAARSLNQVHHGSRVSSSQWHQTDGSILLTAGYDSKIALTDVRISDEKNMSKYWNVMSGEEIETASFINDYTVLAGTDNGNVYSFDVRSVESKPLWTLKAHDAGIAGLSVPKNIPGMLLTGAMGEKVIKLWKFDPSNAKGPSMVLSRDLGVGNVLTSAFAPDIEIGATMIVGGVTGGLKLWDAFSNRTVRKTFDTELRALQNNARELAKQTGRSSRISRKYIHNNNPDTILTVDDNDGDDDENDSD
ncbi:hypothetical protein TBLA_0C05010 [Henningerozyma blattae CBS 6284]|uniref:Uncharacterized protein n=1 Tax=Henningerozyma blattae (strain ATCC 34711 / CBS 6284 / DSM 70876 / NBRC 10599 / NRRL Y-10934 / UCD 77-7) TaxID=1071380 RepID=I2H1P5_HENB6|nr:hypothetical protein TBLA_0C05010 [Tetrapisispora blattae CBS 6284]CCH60297.1 hypothetical protein TBLA_0C05010 [Tetrapisispora blattae CBS 6284]